MEDKASMPKLRQDSEQSQKFDGAKQERVRTYKIFNQSKKNPDKFRERSRKTEVSPLLSISRDHDNGSSLKFNYKHKTSIHTLQEQFTVVIYQKTKIKKMKKHKTLSSPSIQTKLTVGC